VIAMSDVVTWSTAALKVWFAREIARAYLWRKRFASPSERRVEKLVRR
jgi:hypothetical protein